VPVNAQIPANWVAAGYGVPDVCSRHGEPALDRKRVRFISRPPQWSYVLIVFGALIFVIVAAAMRKTVWAPAWPFCARCREYRKRMAGIGLGIVGLSVVMFVGSIAIGSANSDSDTAGSLAAFGVLLAIVAFIAGLAVAVRAASPAVAGGQVSQDGAWLLLPRAHEEFARRLQAVQSGAPQQQYQQQAPQQQYQPQQAAQQQYQQQYQRQVHQQVQQAAQFGQPAGYGPQPGVYGGQPQPGVYGGQPQPGVYGGQPQPGGYGTPPPEQPGQYPQPGPYAPPR
jgi:hypothetical protein